MEKKLFSAHSCSSFLQIQCSVFMKMLNNIDPVSSEAVTHSYTPTPQLHVVSSAHLKFCYGSAENQYTEFVIIRLMKGQFWSLRTQTGTVQSNG